MQSFIDKNRSSLLDEIKGLAIIAVVLFHLGLFKWGYLGVDLFYVIAGYLTARSVAGRIERGSFSYWTFMSDRLRRLCPLVLIAGLVSLTLGCVLMMPDDLDHMARSVFASDLFLNNLLCYHSNSDYWATKNEYAPMLHFWYLGVLMQFYLVYPLIVRAGERLVRKEHRGVKLLVGLLSVLSLVGWCVTPVPLHFYNMPFRFFEFGLGILASYWGIQVPNVSLKVQGLARIGRASFSVYIWHYIILAYARYALAPEIDFMNVAVYLFLLGVVSMISYRLGEMRYYGKPVCFVVFGSSAIMSLFLVWRAGIIYDIPELDITVRNARRGIHLEYCDRIYKYDVDFQKNGKVNVLVMGNSWARDWANVLLESTVSNRINLSYSFSVEKTGRENLLRRIQEADVVFVRGSYRPLELKDKLKVYHIGYKWFGPSNGFAWNRRFRGDYYATSVELPRDILKINEDDKRAVGDRHIDLIGALVDGRGCIPVFSDEKKMISHDCYHLTQGGARYLAKRMHKRIVEVFQ